MKLFNVDFSKADKFLIRYFKRFRLMIQENLHILKCVNPIYFLNLTSTDKLGPNISC
ncbi:hypothetical protein HanIR_Chr04g0191711 [Helianthus annuus]|nr:hypothetical protein HanIR_Chr04g0191711 [Helianthus annuus]